MTEDELRAVQLSCSGWRSESVANTMDELAAIVEDEFVLMKFLRALFQPRKHIVCVSMYGDDVEFGRRRELRNAVITALEQSSLGEYLGGGSMVTDDVPNYDIEFRVIKKTHAVKLIANTLRSLDAGPETKLCIDCGAEQKLYEVAG